MRNSNGPNDVLSCKQFILDMVLGLAWAPLKTWGLEERRRNEFLLRSQTNEIEELFSFGNSYIFPFQNEKLEGNGKASV